MRKLLVLLVLAAMGLGGCFWRARGGEGEGGRGRGERGGGERGGGERGGGERGDHHDGGRGRD